MVPPGWFRLATSPTRDWVARDHEEGDELAPFQLIEVHSIRAGPAAGLTIFQQWTVR
jgi:hypothetical protein